MARVICKRCGANIDIPKDYKSNFITCPNCSNANMLPRQKPVINPSKSSNGMTSSFASTIGIGNNDNQINNLQTINDTNLDKDYVACKWCKEPIPRGVKKCPHCEHLQYETEDKSKINNNLSETSRLLEGYTLLNILDWVIIGVCPCFGFVLGVLYRLGGDPKAYYIFKFSLIYILAIHVLLILVGSLLS